MPEFINITYCNPDYKVPDITLPFKLLDNSVVPKWVERVQTAQALGYSIDEPNRFYGMGTPEELSQRELNRINSYVDIINEFDPIIRRRLERIDDQDTLNYLHNIFEIYHGILDSQTHELWQRAPNNVRQALADLNIGVHRCEFTYRMIRNRGTVEPRHVVTYYGLAKDRVLEGADFDLFEDRVEFGTIYLNYVEIGKTFEDLSKDNDNYIAPAAFQPFHHYSADFHVKFWQESKEFVAQKLLKMNEFYERNTAFFEERGLYPGHPMMKSGLIPLAKLVDTNVDIVNLLSERQWVKSVTFS